jgi:hypothetical protein
MNTQTTTLHQGGFTNDIEPGIYFSTLVLGV